MRLTDRQWTLTGWWLFVICVGFVAVPQGAAAQEVPFEPEVEILGSYPGCDAERAVAMKLYFHDVDVDLDYPAEPSYIGTGRVLVRRAGSLSTSQVSTQRKKSTTGRVRYPDRAQLNAELVLCLSPTEITLGDAEWTIASTMHGKTLTSTHESVSGKITLLQYFYLENQTSAAFILKDSAAELVDRETGAERRVEILTLFGFLINQPESQQ